MGTKYRRHTVAQMGTGEVLPCRGSRSSICRFMQWQKQGKSAGLISLLRSRFLGCHATLSPLWGEGGALRDISRNGCEGEARRQTSLSFLTKYLVAYIKEIGRKLP